ncbi:hypothetical protein [Aerolutibacter daejeonensis]|uniref:hypothetical protein n=1 Tax=Aerolutibacter daejeonensis TaxID=346181 RepID=UPI000689A93A|nr:hypothetical protein [Lysobacter daejeonensis]
MRTLATLMLASLVLPLSAQAGEPARDGAPSAPATTTPAAPHLLDRFKALAGKWSATGLDGNSMPDAQVQYEVTAGGSAVVETLFPGTSHEMRTVYVRDGADVVLTHYCASGNHPRMRARAADGEQVTFAFDGASNFDPATAGHMHDASFTFVDKDELRTRWNFWSNGKPAEHVANLHVKRVAD